MDWNLPIQEEETLAHNLYSKPENSVLFRRGRMCPKIVYLVGQISLNLSGGSSFLLCRGHRLQLRHIWVAYFGKIHRGLEEPTKLRKIKCSSTRRHKLWHPCTIIQILSILFTISRFSHSPFFVPRLLVNWLIFPGVTQSRTQ